MNKMREQSRLYTEAHQAYMGTKNREVSSLVKKMQTELEDISTKDSIIHDLEQKIAK